MFFQVYTKTVKRHTWCKRLFYITFDSAPNSHKESHRSTKQAEDEVWTYRIPVVVQVPNVDRTNPNLGR